MIVAAVAWYAFSDLVSVDPTVSMAHRLGVTLAALLPAGAVLDAMILLQILLRAVSGTIDPTAGEDGRRLRINQRALTNTVEQLVTFTVALLALAAGAPPALMRFVVALALVFALARLAFWIGYLIKPLLRAPGMAATAAVNLSTLAAAIWVWVY